MYKFIIVGLALCVLTAFTPEKGIDFGNKTLRKELQKLSGIEKAEWKEIPVPESLLVSHNLEGKFMALAGQPAGDMKKYIYAGRVNSCRAGGCSNPNLSLDLETSEYFDYLIVFNASASVEQVKVYNYAATHGQEVTNKGWLKQFNGYDGSRSLTVGKSIDAISGATVSVYSITDDIQDKTRLLKKILQSKPGT